MATSKVILETTAKDLIGFPLILGRVVCDLLGCPARPRYVVFENPLSLTGKEYRADVHVDPCPSGTNQPHRITGRCMPTLEQALQVAAFEGLVRLRHAEPAMAESRAFRFFPARSQQGTEVILTSILGEADPALSSIVAYGCAMTKLCHSLMDELETTRRDLGRARLQLYLKNHPSSLTLDQARDMVPPLSNPCPSRQFPGKESVEPSLVVPASGALDHVWGRIHAQGPILQGIPLDPDPSEDGDVDTTLRLGHAPPTTRGRQAE